MTIKILGAEVEFAAKSAVVGAHAEGPGSVASGSGSHAEGTGTIASASSSHAEGSGSTASGFCGHAEGQNSSANGFYTHAEGISANASALAAHAEGSNTAASATYTHAGGAYAKADAIGAWARGALNPSSVSATRAQVGIYTMALVTTTTTATPITFDAQAVNAVNPGINVLCIPTNANYLFNLTLTARRPTNALFSQGWVFNGLLARDTGVCRLIGSTQLTSWNDGSAVGTVALSANTASNYLQIMVTAANTGATHWHGVLTVNEFSSTS